MCVFVVYLNADGMCVCARLCVCAYMNNTYACIRVMYVRVCVAGAW